MEKSCIDTNKSHNLDLGTTLKLNSEKELFEQYTQCFCEKMKQFYEETINNNDIEIIKRNKNIVLKEIHLLEKILSNLKYLSNNSDTESEYCFDNNLDKTILNEKMVLLCNHLSLNENFSDIKIEKKYLF